MSKISTVIRLLRTPHAILPPIMDYGVFDWLPDKLFVALRYYGMTGNILNLKSPRGFNEKLQYLKLYDKRPVYSVYVDKYRVREYVAEMIGEEYLVPLYDKWDTADDINLDALPSQFVLKCNHDSGSVRVVEDRQDIDINEIKRYFALRLKRSAYKYGREWPYKYVKPCVIAEAYLKDGFGELRDYKFFCFDGNVRFFKIDFDRFHYHRANYYDRNKQFLQISEMLVPNDPNEKLDFPAGIDTMIILAERLAGKLPFVRVDFYEAEGKTYFGEMTFFPGSGFDPFSPDEWENKIGDMLNLPNV